jgi:hypothetical protein
MPTPTRAPTRIRAQPEGWTLIAPWWECQFAPVGTGRHSGRAYVPELVSVDVVRQKPDGSELAPVVAKVS